jgi:hypothetical protein
VAGGVWTEPEGINAAGDTTGFYRLPAVINAAALAMRGIKRQASKTNLFIYAASRGSSWARDRASRVYHRALRPAIYLWIKGIYGGKGLTRIASRWSDRAGWIPCRRPARSGSSSGAGHYGRPPTGSSGAGRIGPHTGPSSPTVTGLPKQRSNVLQTLNVHFVAEEQTYVQAQPQIRAIRGPPTR